MKPSVKTDPPMIKTNRGQHRQPKVRTPSEQYLKLSQQESVACDRKETRKQLIVLDLNGTLVRYSKPQIEYRLIDKGVYIRLGEPHW